MTNDDLRATLARCRRLVKKAMNRRKLDVRHIQAVTASISDSAYAQALHEERGASQNPQTTRGV